MSALLFAGAGLSAAGVMVRAVVLAAGVLVATRGLAAGCDCVDTAACGARRPGMAIRSPIFTMVWGGMLLARAISVTDFLYLRDSLLSVSPGATTCTNGDPVA